MLEVNGPTVGSVLKKDIVFSWQSFTKLAMAMIVSGVPAGIVPEFVKSKVRNANLGKDMLIPIRGWISVLLSKLCKLRVAKSIHKSVAMACSG